MTAKILQIGKQHFQNSTINLLDEEVYINNYDCFVVKKVGTGEYLIEVNELGFNAHSKFKFNMPNDLQAIIRYALNIGCSLLYIKEEIRDIEYLPVYKYMNLANDFGEQEMHEQIFYNGALIKDTII